MPALLKNVDNPKTTVDPTLKLSQLEQSPLRAVVRTGRTKLIVLPQLNLDWVLVNHDTLKVSAHGRNWKPVERLEQHY